MPNIFYKILLALLIICSTHTVGNCAIDEDTDKYFQTIARKCLHNYFQSPKWAGGTVSETFILNSDGSTSQIVILTHPKHYKTHCPSPSTDKALLLAIKNAEPFPAPPTALHTPIKLVLTINVWVGNKPNTATVSMYEPNQKRQ